MLNLRGGLCEKSRELSTELEALGYVEFEACVKIFESCQLNWKLWAMLNLRESETEKIVKDVGVEVRYLDESSSEWARAKREVIMIKKKKKQIDKKLFQRE
ncbi:hypothetical protein PanWU01x14_041680 [Parasponia andersonii]|uniref:Uncharacterized protein n=1 Tax=Parasponia andersonii TaxID=3476 RepID=A0A2P5DQH1_PARAD|nr:hypothetical protein PanWU01x14_041680 [Parasponia andersonii]